MASRKTRAGRQTTTLARLEKQFVQAWAKQRRVQAPTAEKVLWLTRILHALSKSPLARDFALMGGSAIVFLHRNMYRLSTDLDLDFVGNSRLGCNGQREVSSRVAKDRRELEAIAGGLGMRFTPKETGGPRFVQYELRYKSNYRPTDSVELDVSYRYGHTVLDPVSKEWPVATESEQAGFPVQTFAPEELYAAKAIAMLDTKERERLDFPEEEYGDIHLITKRKIRHLYDVYLLADDILNGTLPGFNVGVFRDLFVLFGMTRIKGFEYFRGNAIGAYTDEDIAKELKSVVLSDVSLATADVMKWTVRRFLDIHVFNYRTREHRFMEDFRGGQFRPEDLFEDKLATRLRRTQYYLEVLGKVAPVKPKKAKKQAPRKRRTARDSGS